MRPERSRSPRHSMLGFAAIVFAILCTGFATLELFRKRAGAAGFEPLELVTAAALTGVSLWIAANWVLALTHSLTRQTLLVVSAIFIGIALAVLVRSWPRLQNGQVPPRIALELAIASPLFLWLCFILWRGTVIPPLTHDALSYHLPKAVMMARAHGFDYFAAPDTRISHLPANYELLLADVLLLSSSDRLTEWIGAAFFVLFLVACGAVAQRWWKGSSIPVMVTVATAPVLILHSGADKNDLMAGFFAVSALLFGARWATEGGLVPFALLATALTTGAGTKPQQAAILVGLAPFLLRRLVREVRANRAATARYAVLFVIAVLWFGLTGAAAYVYNALHESSPLEVQIAADEGSAPTGVFQWGDWSNLWQFPYLLLTVPFSRFPSAVWVPWRGEYWFWAHYEIYFSHYGILTSLLILALPYCVYRFRRSEGRAGERVVYSIAAVIAVVLTLPVQFRPIGFFGSFPRYLLYVLPAIACWTVAPLYRFVLGRRGAIAALMVLSGVFTFWAVRLAQRDAFAPLQYVRWAAMNPGTRAVYFSPNRSAAVADRLAAPHDLIAIDGGFDTWTHPAYGAGLTRPVAFIASPSDIPHAARWVIVDRSWSSIWGHPLLKDMGTYWKYRSRGTPTADDLAVFNALKGDPRFALIHRDDRLNQAVFWRRVPGMPEPRPRLIRFRSER